MSRVLTVDGSVKIGAKVYGVEITNKLDLGNVNYSGEISYTDLVIRICAERTGENGSRLSSRNDSRYARPSWLYRTR